MAGKRPKSMALHGGVQLVVPTGVAGLVRFVSGCGWAWLRCRQHRPDNWSTRSQSSTGCPCQFMRHNLSLSLLVLLSLNACTSNSGPISWSPPPEAVQGAADLVFLLLPKPPPSPEPPPSIRLQVQGTVTAADGGRVR